MQKRYRVTLTVAEREELRNLVRAGKAAAQKLTRARILFGIPHPIRTHFLVESGPTQVKRSAAGSRGRRRLLAGLAGHASSVAKSDRNYRIILPRLNVGRKFDRG